MRYEAVLRDAVLVSWEADESALARDLPAGLRPARDESGRLLVSLAAFRHESPRLRGVRGPAFGQLDVRTYVERDGEQGSFLYLTRVALPGLTGVAFGLPVRPARIRVSQGRVSAPGVGVELRYRELATTPDARVAFGSLEYAFFVAAGLRRLVTRQEALAWRPAELLDRPRIEPVLALGFDVGEPVSVLSAEGGAFAADVPAQEVG